MGQTQPMYQRRMGRLDPMKKSKSQLELVLEHRKAPESYYINLRNKAKKEQKNLAVALSELAGVALDRPASLNDIEAFEEALDI